MDKTLLNTAKKVGDIATEYNQLAQMQNNFNNAQSGGQKAMALAQMIAMILG